MLGRCFRGGRCKYLKGHVKKGDITDAFTDAVINCISKGVLHYTNLSEGENPTNK
jgi:hypothetical protein